MNRIKRIFNKKARLFLTCCALLAISYQLSAMPQASAASNLPEYGNIGDFGTWSTEANKTKVNNSLHDDIQNFQGNFQVQVKDNYVPIEARLGKVFIEALSRVGQILADSLFSFVQIFLIILLAFWIGLETYTLIQGKTEVKKLAMEILKKGIWLTIWFWVLSHNPADIFMFVFGPIINAGTYLSDMILNGISSSVNIKLPDTCEAIRTYVATSGGVISPQNTADLLCMPTRLSGFFYSAVAAGFRWMAYGIGHSALTFFAGAVFVAIFVINIWKFALMAFGVITDLFLVLIMLPFTAINSLFGSGTTLTGPVGDIFKAFAGMFNKMGLSEQIQKFLKAIIYFIVLTIVAAIGAALLGTVVDASVLDDVTAAGNDRFMTILIVGCLVAYLADQAGKLAEALGGEIKPEFGTQLGKDISNFAKAGWKQYKDWRKIFKEGKK